ncbi:MAG: hypothetical protein M0Q52_10625 [Lascolabacillus sp.]|jgi:hypothetical protein|nr:hypothetical protein [Lascolabacillus sp.]
MNCDLAKENLQKFNLIYEEYKNQDLTESDTRSKIIDYMLINILGWNEADICREEFVRSGYFDYKLSIAGFNVVVEAKKSLCELILPKQKRQKFRLKTIYNDNKDVINQIRRYLVEVGCDLGIITNGKQFIVAKFINNNGKPWLDNTCIVYNGIEDINENFVDFWNNLSKIGIINNGGIQPLNINEIEFTKTILSTISEKDNEITRNDIASKIAPIISKVFGEIYNNDDDNDDIQFIKECFVENKEVIKNKAELNGLFRDNAPLLSEVIKAKNHESIVQQINEEIKIAPPLSKNQITPKPVIIIGSKGAGKTTFLKFLFKQRLPEDTISNYPYIYINLMKYYSGSDEIDFEKISKDALEQFNDLYSFFEINTLRVLKRIYIKEINEKDKGVWKHLKENNPEKYEDKLSVFLEEKIGKQQAHLEALNLYLTREIHKRIILVFDNADQLDDKIQEKIFLFACSLNVRAKFGVFISLREGYYYKWRNQPPFNAFESNVYHIAAPDYGIVLQKRIDYAIKYLHDNNIGGVRGYTSAGFDLQIGEDKITEFFAGIRSSLFGVINSPILEFIRHTTFPNIREGLRLFKVFLTSGYTDVEEYILRVIHNKDSHQITIPIHEFAKTIGLENKLYYNHSTSNIKNLFYPSPNNFDYFTKIWILKRLEEQLQYEGNINKFLDYNKFVDEFCEYGYRKDILNQEIEELLQNSFIEADKVISDIKWNELPREFSITITAKGLYYIQNIINKFYYIELVLQDTPIFNSEKFEEIRSIFPLCDNRGKRDMSERIKVVEAFINYLFEKEQMQQPIVLKKKYGNIINNILANGLKTDIQRIKLKMNI